jgi:hypothetical protein
MGTWGLFPDYQISARVVFIKERYTLQGIGLSQPIFLTFQPPHQLSRKKPSNAAERRISL